MAGPSQNFNSRQLFCFAFFTLSLFSLNDSALLHRLDECADTRRWCLCGWQDDVDKLKSILSPIERTGGLLHLIMCSLFVPSNTYFFMVKTQQFPDKTRDMLQLAIQHRKPLIVAKRGSSYVLFYEEIQRQLTSPRLSDTQTKRADTHLATCRQLHRQSTLTVGVSPSIYGLNAIEFYLLSFCRYLSPHATKHIQVH